MATAPTTMMTTTGTVALPTVLSAVEEILSIAETLAEIEPRLRDRIERNRARSERHRRHAGTANGNGHRTDRIVLGRSGLRVECRTCNRVLAVHAMPEPKNTNGGTR